MVSLIRGRPAALAAVAPYDQLLLSVAVMGELAAGAYGARDPASELARLKAQTADLQVVRADEQTAYLYGELLDYLKRQGKPIPINDLWIAAAAIQYDLPLVARDEHFRRLPRLRLVGY